MVGGSGEVRAKRRAAAMGSAMQLNSATGVMLPGVARAPDMATTSFAFRKVSGRWEAARAKVVRGPMPMRVIVLGGVGVEDVQDGEVGGGGGGGEEGGVEGVVCGGGGGEEGGGGWGVEEVGPEVWM